MLTQRCVAVRPDDATPDRSRHRYPVHASVPVVAGLPAPALRRRRTLPSVASCGLAATTSGSPVPACRHLHTDRRSYAPTPGRWPVAVPPAYLHAWSFSASLDSCCCVSDGSTPASPSSSLRRICCQRKRQLTASSTTRIASM